MIYPEAAYFDGAHVQHIADYQEHQRLDRIKAEARKRLERPAHAYPVRFGCRGQ